MKYKTKDLYLASTLIALGYSLEELEKEGNIFYFVFPKNSDEKLELNIGEYWAGNLLIDPIQLFNAFRTLKARMYNQP